MSNTMTRRPKLFSVCIKLIFIIIIATRCILINIIIVYGVITLSLVLPKKRVDIFHDVCHYGGGGGVVSVIRIFFNFCFV